jgi:hypothetical protein
MRARKIIDQAAEAGALAAWRRALPVTAMRLLIAAGYAEADRRAWLAVAAPRMDDTDAYDFAALAAAEFEVA